MNPEPPPGGGGDGVSKLINNRNDVNSRQHQNKAAIGCTTAGSSMSLLSISQQQSDGTSRSVQTATGDTVSEKIKEFNLQKPQIYSDKIYVFLEKTNNENIGRLHPMVVGHILHRKLNIPNILKIEKVGRNRVRVELKSIKDANNLVNNSHLKTENLKAFIPKNLLERKGIVRYVDTIFDDKYLFENIMSPYRITEVSRFKRKVTSTDGETHFVPKQTILLTFEGNVLPKVVYINYVSCVVEPYVQRVVQCYKCLRYGHVAKQCNSTSSLCINCSKDKDPDHECRDPQDSFCLFCKNNNHKTISKNCPKYEEQARIKKIMAENNLTFLESKNNLNNSYSNVLVSNSFTALDTDNTANFPHLNSNKNHKQSHNVQNRSVIPRPTQLPSHTQTSFSKTQTEHNNKKRKAHSPINLSSHPPMFPFTFGPDKPIPHYQKEAMEVESGDTDLFVTNFFKFFQLVLNDIETFDDIKNIDTEYIKNKMSIFSSNLNYEHGEFSET